MSKRNPERTARVTIDGWGMIEVVARTAGAAVCRARRELEKIRRGYRVAPGPVHTFADRAEGWWKNVHLEWLR